MPRPSSTSERHHRLDVGLVPNHPSRCTCSVLGSLTFLFLTCILYRVSSFVGKGILNLEITGHNVVLRRKHANFFTESLRLGFGICALEVQVPQVSLIESPRELAGKLTLTSFKVLAHRQVFGENDKGMGLSSEKATQIKCVGGVSRQFPGNLI